MALLVAAKRKTEAIWSDPRSAESYRLAAKVAATGLPVMIQGESGTGKEVIARYIHEQSDRAQAPFVAINCAAIPESMLESLLFGHERGAFTGALTARDGKFTLANGGTLLLDEVTEMSLPLQAKLLRVIQEREVEPLGAKRPTPVDVRVLATTNRDLAMRVHSGEFREDLYYRLNVFPLPLAPLRERPGDIWPLAEYFLAGNAHLTPRSMSFAEECRSALNAYAWPGNVRELENRILRAMILCEGSVIEPKDLDLPANSLPMSARTTESGQQRDLASRMSAAEADVIRHALAANEGRRRGAAAALGVSERTLRYKLARMREAGLLVE